MFLFIYRTIVNFILIFSPFILFFRILKKKEHTKRFIEKFGKPNHKRQVGKLIWFHGSSVGEILSVIPLIEKLEKKNGIKQILLTSSTLSSAKVFKKFKLKKTIHQFFPLDSNFISKKFINYWKPSTAIFIESEIWPNMILNLKKKKIPLVLINARITKRTFKKWHKISFFSKSIFNKFDICLAQNNETKFYLNKLGSKNIIKAGNLKFSETMLKNKYEIRNNIKKYLKKKKILFGAISTHDNEEIFCAKIHLDLKKRFLNGISIIIPRHVHRSRDIKDNLEKFGLKVHLHSSKEKINENIDIYLVDTFGETNFFQNKCKVVFLGGSLIKHGGHNPIEAARIGCKVIHGPFINNFTEVYKLLSNNKISSKIKNHKEAKKIIINSISKRLASKKIIKKLSIIGKKILSQNEKGIKNYI